VTLGAAARLARVCRRPSAQPFRAAGMTTSSRMLPTTSANHASRIGASFPGANNTPLRAAGITQTAYVREVPVSDKPRLHWGMLTPRDLKRAKASVTGGKDPLEFIQDKVDEITLTIWCFKSRTDPEFTWDQAEATPLGEFDLREEDKAAPPPPTAGPGLNGSEPGSENDSGPRVSLPSAASTG
jgi:hypothetical protein